ncbi:MAG TPA: carboxypeptidase-like regulatory domain-containing protein, partial [Pyrinomonadaceae bacterium]|nr:carboxypeptidase-like regulatory domain-containing protein [Pyrinomonadaceae bacterium]
MITVVATAQQQLTKISGVVSDPNGSAIANASVEFAANGHTVRTETDAAGSFTVLSPQPYGTLSVSSPGFSTIKFEVTTASEPLQIRLEPAPVIERILV